MKREHIESKSYIDWLKSMGCVFYAPLDQTNGLDDLISGVVGTASSDSSAVYDTGSDSYLVTKGNTISVSAPALKWYGLDMASYFTSQTYGQYTYLIEIKGVSSLDNASGNFCFQNFRGRPFASNMANCGFSVPSSQFYKLAWCGISDGVNYTHIYRDGNSVWSNKYSAGNWSSYSTTIFTGLELQNPSNYSANRYYSAKAYYRNIMLFCKTLTQSDVRQIQGIS